MKIGNGKGSSIGRSTDHIGVQLNHDYEFMISGKIIYVLYGIQLWFEKEAVCMVKIETTK